MVSTYIGTKQTLSGIPSLLISDLGRVQDPVVQRALYQIQNYANSIGVVHGTTGSNSAGFGANNCPAIFAGAVTSWVQVSYLGAKAYIPVWV